MFLVIARERTPITALAGSVLLRYDICLLPLFQVLFGLTRYLLGQLGQMVQLLREGSRIVGLVLCTWLTYALGGCLLGR